MITRERTTQGDGAPACKMEGKRASGVCCGGLCQPNGAVADAVQSSDLHGRREFEDFDESSEWNDEMLS